jgi:hypothetical protein
MANRLAIESRGKFQAEVLKERFDAIRPEAVQQQQRAAEAMLQTNEQMAARNHGKRAYA